MILVGIFAPFNKGFDKGSEILNFCLKDYLHRKIVRFVDNNKIYCQLINSSSIPKKCKI